MKVVTYTRAKQRARTVGWSKADNDGMRAAGADLLARHLCLNAIVIYNWAQKHNVNIHNTTGIRELLGNPMRTVDYILADKPWEVENG